MKQLRYKLNNDGYMIACGYRDDCGQLTNGSEPFKTIDEALDYRKDLNTNEWIYDPIIMIPESISKLQATQHLLNINRHADLMTIIDADETGQTRLLYDAAHQLDRDSNMVNQLGEAMGFSQQELDELFVEASKIMV